MDQSAVSDIFSTNPYLYQQFRTLSNQTYRATEPTFFNTECSKSITHTELMKFINSNPNKYLIFMFDYGDYGIYFEILNFNHIISNLSPNESQFYNYYNCIAKDVYYSSDTGFEIQLSPYIITRELTHIDEPKFYHDTSNFDPSFEALIDSFRYILDVDLYHPAYSVITLDVKSIYDIIFSRQLCITYFGDRINQFAKDATIKHFDIMIDMFLNYSYGQLILNWYLAENAKICNINFNTILLHYDFGFNVNINDFIERTEAERNRLISVIKKAIHNFL